MLNQWCTQGWAGWATCPPSEKLGEILQGQGKKKSGGKERERKKGDKIKKGRKRERKGRRGGVRREKEERLRSSGMGGERGK